MRRLKANAKKALCFNYDVFRARKFEDPSLHFQDWLKEEQDKHHDIDRQWYVQIRAGAPMVSTERTPLASSIRQERPRPLPRPSSPLPLQRQTPQPEEQPETFGSSWD